MVGNEWTLNSFLRSTLQRLSLTVPRDLPNMRPDEPSEVFLPKLSTLSIVIPAIDEFDPKSLVPGIVSELEHMLNARASDFAPPDQRLKTLRVSTSHAKLLPEIQSVVAPFGGLGLQFEVTSNDITPDWCQKPVNTGLHKWQDGIDERLEKRKPARKLVPTYPEPPRSPEYTSYLESLD
ncbi:hypothetical protein CPB83DRAFT_844468 [Crepidotus variabilis]|uniref:Uncharacterized protein n=1 Tax=Crepidotus variabilis TaxID=179855 RepID=A0A9P6ERJ3_9AGAR|nr:hypothetical protein CPB83DRAFT_844468 [Crepidotus variabilis]